MKNVEIWSNILQKLCSVHTVSFLKYVWSSFNIINYRIKGDSVKQDTAIERFSRKLILKVGAIISKMTSGEFTFVINSLYSLTLTKNKLFPIRH